MASAQTIPRDLITLREAVEQMGVSKPRLKFWYLRGIVRSWKLNNRILVSRAEVRRELRRRDGITPRTRKGYMGELSATAAPIGRPQAPRAAAGASPPLPELPDLPPGVPWDYTGS